jgi:hypothetical protein
MSDRSFFLWQFSGSHPPYETALPSYNSSRAKRLTIKKATSLNKDVTFFAYELATHFLKFEYMNKF